MRRTRSSQPPKAELAEMPPKDGELQRQLTRVAWMYFMENRNQEDIARALGLNRMRVNRMLTAARENGIVRIEIDGSASPLAELEAQMRIRFGVEQTRIVPNAGDAATTLSSIGIALGTLLNGLLADGQIVGIHRGQTCHSLFQGLRSASYPKLSVVSLQGDLSSTGQMLPQEGVARLAMALNASCYYLAAPTYASTVSEQRTLMGLHMIRSVLSLARRCDIAIMSPGAMIPPRKRILKELIPEQELAQLQKLKAVGSILGVMFDSEGRVIDHEINERRIGLDLDDLTRIPHVVMVGMGPEKVDIMHIALRRGGIATVVTDEQTARSLLRKEDAQPPSARPCGHAKNGPAQGRAKPLG